jgi:hypothetical protein
MLVSGVCEKCGWDTDGDDYATVTRAPALCIVCRDEVSVDGRCVAEHWHGLHMRGPD